MNINILVIALASGFIFMVLGILALDYLEREERCNEQKIEFTRYHEFNDTTKNWVKLSWALDKCSQFYPSFDVSRYK